jgi:putative transposase
VAELRREFPLKGLLKVAGLCRSTFYYRLGLLERKEQHIELKQAIRRIFVEHKGRYGYRRITATIRRAGTLVNHKTVQRLMQKMNLKSIARTRRYRVFRGGEGLIAPNALNRKFKAQRPNQKWVTDVTEFHLGREKLYLAPIVDLFNGEVVAYETARRPLYGMISEMLRKAFARLAPQERPMLHSDQGWQYRMPIYNRTLAERLVKPSMSRKGNCYDNAPMESFFGALKAELFHHSMFDTVEQLQEGLREYIAYYNNDRIKLKLKGLSPVQYRLEFSGC